MTSFAESTKKLCEASRKSFLNPYTYIDWPASMPQEQWYISPEFISIYGTDAYESLRDSEKQKLSFFEAVNFFSLNIHGEKSLVEGLAKRLYARNLQDYTAYLHHFLDEENKHMIYFGGFCERYAGKIYRDRKMVVPREYEEGEEDFLFFAKVMIFEEIVDYYNVHVSADEQIEPTARKINLIHHLEEARHLVFGRQMVEYLFDKYATMWGPQTTVSVRQYLSDYIIATWKEYYNPDVYKDAGLSQPYDLIDISWNSDLCRQHRQKVSARLIAFLKDKQILLEAPSL